MNNISDRLNKLSESETLAMTQKSRELKAKGFNVINLSIGEPDFDTPAAVKNAAKKAIDDNFSHYTPVSGYPELREAICNKLRRDNHLEFAPDQIVVSTGAKQSIANVMLSLVNPGDEVLMPSPYWVSYKEIVKMADGNAIYIQAGIDQDFKVTAKQLGDAITPKTRVLIFSSPCNPSGSVYSKEELKAIADVLAQHENIYVIADEIYEYINFIGEHESIAQFENIRERVIVVNVLSKGFAMTGWRIGFIAAPKFIAKACDKLQGQFTSGTCSIAQRAAIEAFNTDPSKSEELKNMVKTFKERRDLMLGLLKEIPGLKTNMPDGAFYIFMNVQTYFGKSDGSCTINDCNDMANYLLDKVHVATVAGSAFGDPNCIRISYATSSELLKEAADRISKALSELK
jgi:aspartate aminotransferase